MAKPHPRRSTLTVAQWARLTDVPGELVDGELVEEEMASFVHEWLVQRLGRALFGWFGEDALVTGSETKLAVSDVRGRKPDVCAWLPGSPLPPPLASVSHTPPDIAVEVVTPTPRDEQRDRVEKRDEYAAFGIHLYWIVDPTLRTFDVFELSEGAYELRGRASSGTLSVIPGVPEAVLDLDALWAGVDRLLARYAEQREG